MCMTRKKASKSLQEKTSELACVARVVIRELASRDESKEADEAAELLERALTEAVAGRRASDSRKSARQKTKSRSKE